MRKVLFLAVNMKNCVPRNVRKHKEIKGSDKYVTLDISSKFDSLDKMKITSSESKVKLERSGKGFEKFEKLPYEKKRPKYEPTDSYFHLSRQLAKCMMRSDNLNWHDHGGYTEITAPSLNFNATDEDE